jgi:hypothetical protein
MFNHPNSLKPSNTATLHLVGRRTELLKPSFKPSFKPSSFKPSSSLHAVEVRWSRLSEQIFRVDKWSLCRVKLPSGEAAG